MGVGRKHGIDHGIEQGKGEACPFPSMTCWIHLCRRFKSCLTSDRIAAVQKATVQAHHVTRNFKATVSCVARIVGPIANLKGHYFQPSLSVSLCVCL